MPHQRVEQPKVAKLPAPSRHRSPTLSHRLCAATVTLPPPFLGGRKIDHVHHPRQHVCKRRRCDRIPKVRTWPAPSRHRSPDTLAHCARPRSHSRRRFSVIEKRPRRPFVALSSVVTDSGAASARGNAFFRLCDLFVTHHQRLHRCRHILGRLYPQRACPTIYFYAMWAQAKEFEGSPPPPPVIAPISDNLGGCRIGAVSLGCSCARP